MGNILIVEDQTEFAVLLSAELEALGHYVVVSSSVRRGIEQLRRSQVAADQPEHIIFDVALIDMDFPNPNRPSPNSDGLEVFEEAIKVPYLEPIIMTGFDNLNSTVIAANKGVFRYILKDQDTISTAIEITGQALNVKFALVDIETRLDNLRQVFGRDDLPLEVKEIGLEHVRVLSQSHHVIMKSRRKAVPMN